MKTINDGVAIHDAGFQFYLLLNIKKDINDLIKDLINIEECKEYHKERKDDKENTWYNSKTKLRAWGTIKGYERDCEFTLKEINDLYKERKIKYDYLIGMVGESLNEAIASYERGNEWRKPSGAEDRSDVLIDHSELDGF